MAKQSQEGPSHRAPVRAALPVQDSDAKAIPEHGGAYMITNAAVSRRLAHGMILSARYTSPALPLTCPCVRFFWRARHGHLRYQSVIIPVTTLKEQVNAELSKRNLGPMTDDETKMLTNYLCGCIADQECNDGPFIRIKNPLCLEVCQGVLAICTALVSVLHPSNGLLSVPGQCSAVLSACIGPASM